LAFRILILLAGLASMPCNAEFRDPTQPAYPLPSTTVDDAVSDSPLVLSAIWISSHSRRATINGISAKQGQTIVIRQTPDLKPAPAHPATTEDKNTGSLDAAAQATTSPMQESITSLQGNVLAPQFPGQSTVTAEAGTRQSPNTVHHAETAPARSRTIKIISIRKNSVTITQNGELKTLQLVQRPYKTTNTKYTLK
jgi:hypothetical protein